MRRDKGKKNDDALIQLEDGLKTAINSNFNLLREVVLS